MLKSVPGVLTYVLLRGILCGGVPSIWAVGFLGAEMGVEFEL